MRQVALGIVSAAVLATGAGAASAACTVETFRGDPAAITTVRMLVSSGEVCGTRHMRTRYGKSEQRVFPSTRMTLTSRPRHGTATITGSRVSYVSNKGYKGSDTFSYTSLGTPIGKKAPRNYRYQMQVTVY